MENLKNKAENLTDSVGQYLETAYKILTLHAIKKLVNFASSSFITVVITIFALFALLFLGLGLSWWLGTLLHSIVGGLFIVGGLYILLIMLILVFKKKFIFPRMRNYLIKNLYE